MKINIQIFGGGGGSFSQKGQYREVTHPQARIHGHREYVDNKTEIKVRYDPPRNNDPGHWHVENPNMTGNEDMYLDKNGNPSPRHAPESALTYEEFLKLMEELRRGKQ